MLFRSRGVLTACSPKTTLTRLLPRGILEHKKQVAADHIPTRKRGIADAKVNVALSGRVNMSKHEKWRGDGIDLRLACNCYHTYQQAIDAARACVRGQVPDAIPGLAQVTNAFDPSMSPKGKDLWWFWTGLTPSFPEEGWDVARKKITDSIIKANSALPDTVGKHTPKNTPLKATLGAQYDWALGGGTRDFATTGAPETAPTSAAGPNAPPRSQPSSTRPRTRLGTTRRR